MNEIDIVDLIMRSEILKQDQLIDVSIVEGAEGISEFWEQWDNLFARAVDAPPYLSRPWMSTYIEEGWIKGTPLFILAWCGTKLVALFPLIVRKCLTAKIAMPIGTGQGSYLGLLLDPNYQSVIKHMVDTIKSRKVFDVYYSTDLYSEDVATHNLLLRLTEQGYSYRRVFRDSAHYIQLGCSFDEYLKRKIKKGERRKKLRYKERRLFRSADVRVTRYVGRDVTSEINKRVTTVQLESWMKRRGAAVLGKPFYQKLLLKMTQAGIGHVWLMTIDGDDAAFAYAFVAHGKLHYYWPAFKLKYESTLSIGQILLMQVIRDACDEGIVSFDFLHGDAEYKRFWATNTAKVDRVVAGYGIRGHLIATYYYIIWRVAKNEWFRSSYRRMRSKLRSFREKTVKA